MNNSKKALFLTLCTIFSSLPVGAMEPKNTPTAEQFKRDEANLRIVENKYFCSWLLTYVAGCGVAVKDGSAVITVRLRDLFLQNLLNAKNAYSANMPARLCGWIDTMINDLNDFKSKLYPGEVGIQWTLKFDDTTLRRHAIVDRHSRLLNLVDDPNQRAETLKKIRKNKMEVNFNHFLSSEGGSMNNALTVASLLKDTETLTKQKDNPLDLSVFLPAPGDGNAIEIKANSASWAPVKELAAKIAAGAMSSDSDDIEEKLNWLPGQEGQLLRFLKTNVGLRWELFMLAGLEGKYNSLKKDWEKDWEKLDPVEFIKKLADFEDLKSSRGKPLLLRHALWGLGLMACCKGLSTNFHGGTKSKVGKTTPQYKLEQVQSELLGYINSEYQKIPKPECLPDVYRVAVDWGDGVSFKIEYKPHVNGSGPLRVESNTMNGMGYADYNKWFAALTVADQLTVMNVLHFVLHVGLKETANNLTARFTKTSSIIDYSSETYDEKAKAKCDELCNAELKLCGKIDNKTEFTKTDKKNWKQVRDYRDKLDKLDKLDGQVNSESTSSLVERKDALYSLIRKEMETERQDIIGDKTTPRYELQCDIKLKDMLPDNLRKDYLNLQPNTKLLIGRILTVLIFSESLRMMDRGKYVASVINRELAPYGLSIQSRYKDERFDGILTKNAEETKQFMTEWMANKYENTNELLKKITDRKNYKTEPMDID